MGYMKRNSSLLCDRTSLTMARHHVRHKYRTSNQDVQNVPFLLPSEPTDLLRVGREPGTDPLSIFSFQDIPARSWQYHHVNNRTSSVSSHLYQKRRIQPSLQFYQQSKQREELQSLFRP